MEAAEHDKLLRDGFGEEVHRVGVAGDEADVNM